MLKVAEVTHMYVGQVMTSDVVTIDQNASVDRASQLMQEGRFRHLPVVGGGRLVGIIADRDIRLALAHAVGASMLVDAWLCRTPVTGNLLSAESQPRQKISPRIGAIMRRPVVTVEPGTPIEEASRLMLENKIGSLPVMEGDRLVGIVTESDLFRMVIDLLGLKAPSTRLQFELTRPTAQLAEITRIACELDVPIVSLITEPEARDGSRTVVLRVGTIAPEPFIRRLGFIGIDIYRPSRLRPAEVDVPVGAF